MKRINQNIHIIVALIATIMFLSSCKIEDKTESIGSINTSHLDYLYEEINVNSIDMAVIHIYANSPSYKYIDDEDEGMACVDDAARAAVLYLELFKSNSNEEFLKKQKYLIEFLLYMQADNGYFYNFVWNDNSINVEHKNSLAEPNWWSWRALWALTESHKYYKSNDIVFANKIWNSIEKLIGNIKNEIPIEMKTEQINGLDIPTWLPNYHAADQSSILLLGLVNYFNQTKDEAIKKYISMLCEGILQMQISDRNNQYYGAFLSWQNNWHAWGNCQSYALLKSYEVLNDERFLKYALIELDNYFPMVVDSEYINSFSITKINGNIKIDEQNQFSQIAYNIRPMIYALVEAFEITKTERYLKLAFQLEGWFYGSNLAKSIMYNKINGIVFDGIESEKKVNMNSGAESTIEALLSLHRIAKYKSVVITEIK